jgi:hypothetical protein
MQIFVRSFYIQRCLKQGDTLTPLLFNSALEDSNANFSDQRAKDMAVGTTASHPIF